MGWRGQPCLAQTSYGLWGYPTLWLSLSSLRDGGKSHGSSPRTVPVSQAASWENCFPFPPLPQSGGSPVCDRDVASGWTIFAS